MKNLVTAAVFAVLLAWTTGCARIDSVWSGKTLDGVATVAQSNTVPTGVTTLEVENKFGALHVVGVDSDARWTWTLAARAETDVLAGEAAAMAACTAVQDGNRFKLQVALPPQTSARSYRSDLVVHVPRAVNVVARNGFGETLVSGVNGKVDTSSAHGRMTLENIGGEVRARNSFGTLGVTDAGPANLSNSHGDLRAARIKGRLDAESSFGTIEVSDVDGEVKLRNQHGRLDVHDVQGGADLRTTFGSLNVTRIAGDTLLNNHHGSVDATDITGSVTATTSFSRLNIAGSGASYVCRNQHGSIQLNAASPGVTNVDVETSFGSIDVRLRKELKPVVVARTSFGEVESDFPVMLKPRGADAFEHADSTAARVSLGNRHGSIKLLKE
ncbi:MAG TPA: hypothetical protein VEH04_18540 [Verrucomicrobiae bacterium]|nr:hypothetical protein [Verrucomicrobiae bacterium]